ncbi:colanic acid biosynthesis glycosyl transferase [Skermanella stibiiresistens SB22]|uniref:Colanic acid biosynthesis glycosyl transferase n=1 Tax=Skermanella stibiiresistens SB22 TaxID=1385369 RepID=W9GYE1_9PROT|nr:glycosyltransferase family 2 protein [Skermanella stibiiresistens]EWY38834.1 colanic acid biosynthesis glycosyl transferase [Skermanella stibiiresistens SB22]
MRAPATSAPHGRGIPLFSIITVVLNDRDGLEATRRSLLRQTCRDFEWIIVDGGSADGTAAAIRSFGDEVAWWRSAADRGPYDAMNNGMAAAKGEYLLFLNADDTLVSCGSLAWLKGEILAGATPDGPLDFVYCATLERSAGGGLRIKPARSHRMVWYGMFTHHQAMIYRRAVVAGLAYDLSFTVGADYAFTIEALGRSARVARGKQPLAVFAPAGLSGRLDRVGRLDQTRIRRKFLSLPVVFCFLIIQVQSMTMLVRRRWPVIYEICRCWRMYG